MQSLLCFALFEVCHGLCVIWCLIAGENGFAVLVQGKLRSLHSSWSQHCHCFAILQCRTTQVVPLSGMFVLVYVCALCMAVVCFICLVSVPGNFFCLLRHHLPASLTYPDMQRQTSWSTSGVPSFVLAAT